MSSERGGRPRIEFRDAPMEGDLFNPLVLLAEILEERDLGITFNRNENHIMASNVRNIEPKIAFDTTDEGEEVLTRLMDTPEYRTLKLISTYHDSPETLPELLQCQWDEDTQGKVYVTFLERKATGFELDAKTATQSETRTLARKEAIELATLAAFYKRALENKRSIEPQDAKALLSNLVNRKLPQTTQPQ